jgi:hypothetical protein
MHTRVEIMSGNGPPMAILYGQLVGLSQLLHAQGEHMMGRHHVILAAAVGEDGVNRAVAWRWAGEEATMEWQPLPFATSPEPEGEGD